MSVANATDGRVRPYYSELNGQLLTEAGRTYHISDEELRDFAAVRCFRTSRLRRSLHVLICFLRPPGVSRWWRCPFC